ncbi:uncharacterized aarF domain-containing protein kinase 2-like isoform X2 [Belonocnema kinseyi]|uniref:uncharacterized aarF domain-containing protein kinase 2-like isoform X2 n=1 Tax=Belonocnema kinseyi TaxID=2817044 RepID=UPI00143DCC4D|nr:uncharacterized aarF domain-containing protein kinase 2-like isoform X2 [Belonocnema kinseyi]XP_033216005.1 uncharacterized aarF domain-containing protein kinase 2-like isoform X2 [Belonocnema kinseyi]
MKFTTMRPFLLNKLNPLNPSKFLITRSTIKKSAVKRFQSIHVRENYRDWAKRTFFKIAANFPQGKNSKVQIPLYKKNEDSSSLLNLGLDLAFVILRIIFISTVIFGLLTFYWTTRLLRIYHVFPPVLLKAIELLGPTFIKFGQWIATRRDIFPEEFCWTLSKLQRYAATHSWTYTKHLLEVTYGPDWKELFLKFDSDLPIGSGCCAQVYKAWIDREATVDMRRDPKISNLIEIGEYLNLNHLLDLWNRTINKAEELQPDLNSNSNKIKFLPVAVKILHPRIEKRLERDLKVMHFISVGIEYFFPSLKWLSITDCVEEFSKIMSNQVNMEIEALNLIQFSKHFSGKAEIVFPNPIMKYTDRRILVETFHNGSCIFEYLDCNNMDLKHKIAKIGIKTVLKMIFEDNFVHCDLHPGNILVENIKTASFGLGDFFEKICDLRFGNENRLRLVILDCGLVASLDERCRKNFRDVFRSVAKGDGELAGQYLLDHTRKVIPNPEGFKKALDNIVQTHLKNQVTLANIRTNLVAICIENSKKICIYQFIFG